MNVLFRNIYIAKTDWKEHNLRCVIASALLLGILFIASVAPALASPAINLGTASGVPGAVVTIPVTLITQGASISSIAMDIGYDATKLENPTAVAGPTGTASSKSVIKNTPSSGIFRIGAISLTDIYPISDGVVINVSFTIKSTATAGDVILSNTPAASNDSGNAVIATGAAGKITIGTIIGSCGSASGQIFSSAPAADLCAAGTASTVTGSGPWNWTCQEINGENRVCCSADLFASINKIKLAGSCALHASLQEAYASAIDGETLLIQVYTLTENLFFNLPKQVKLSGGKNATYGSTVGVTTLQGSISIEQGSAEISDVVIW